jgi:hypothetical protein
MCPRCRSNNLWIKELNLWELVLSATSGERTYLCRQCEHSFRAPDKRRVMRPSQLDTAVTANASSQAQIWAD